ncbi:hypothetical protein ASF19_17580 [Acidovorax sp. Leaf84]|nr:hypothetical protein ASF19_17580 [Acidovorax sp. Leaf84]
MLSTGVGMCLQLSAKLVQESKPPWPTSWRSVRKDQRVLVLQHLQACRLAVPLHAADDPQAHVIRHQTGHWGCLPKLLSAFGFFERSRPVTGLDDFDPTVTH